MYLITLLGEYFHWKFLVFVHRENPDQADDDEEDEEDEDEDDDDGQEIDIGRYGAFLT